MVTLESPQIAQQTAVRWKREERIALVPTMGCLHEGHLQLVQVAQELAERVIVSIFVNPLQFGKGEDFEKYPRNMDEDAAKLEALNVDLLFCPRVVDMYPNHYQTRMSLGPLTEHLCGKTRPGHFNGVAAVCLKLFNICAADIAVFGEKDYQQLRIIQKVTEDLNMPISIIAHPTVREADGLAMSSRNRYLSDKERAMAGHLPTALMDARALSQSNSRESVATLNTLVRERLGGFQVDYVEVASEIDLTPNKPDQQLSDIVKPRLFVAAKIGDTRLIDNVSLGKGELSV